MSEELPIRGNMSVIESVFAPLTGKRILDVGCGGGALLSALVKREAEAVGIDPNPKAIETAASLVPECKIHVASAEDLPFAAAYFDGVIFLNSLHHIPVAAMEAALSEAVRVARDGASLLIIEPAAEGAFFETVQPIEDETEVRKAAQLAITHFIGSQPDVDGKQVQLKEHFRYIRRDKISDVDALIAKAVAVDPARSDAAIRNRAEVASRFARLAVEVDGTYVLDQPLIAHVLKIRAL